MILRWRAGEVRTGITGLRTDVNRLGDSGRAATDRLIDGTRRLTTSTSVLGRTHSQVAGASLTANGRLLTWTQRLETANRALQRQAAQTGQVGAAAADRITDHNRTAERATSLLGRAYDAVMRRIWELGRQRPGDQLAASMRGARTEAERTAGVLARLQRAGQAGGSMLAGAAAAKFILAKPVNATMDYGMRLAGMANTAYSDRDVAGRIAGKTELNTAIEKAVRLGGGTRESAATTLDTLIAAGTLSVDDSKAVLPTLTKASTASGADPTELANIALRSMATFKIKASEIPKVMDMAITAGQAGGFELKDMAKWLPQQMAAARLSGMSGMGGLAKLLAANQASVITAGSKDEAGNNLVNFLAKINSQDTAQDAKKLGIDLSGTLSAARAKGIDSLQAFTLLTERTVSQDKRYTTLKDKAAKTKDGDEKKATYEAQADIIEGSAIGKLIQDRQALMYLVAALNNKDYLKDVEAKVNAAKDTTETNYAVIANEAGFKKEQAVQEGDIATYKGMTQLDGPLKKTLDLMTETAREYPNLTAGAKLSATALSALAAAAGASGLMKLLTGAGGAAASGAAAGAAGTAAGAAATGVGAAAAGATAPSLLARLSGAVGSGARGLMTTGAFAATMPAASFAAAAPAATAGAVVAAGAAGYGIGSVINKATEGTAFDRFLTRAVNAVYDAVTGEKQHEAVKLVPREPVEVNVKITTDSHFITAEVSREQQRQATRK
ncbi:tail tape measure protein [Duganella sp. CY15W]|uniref:phage tail tape measure protein n=1 Tax=Duganella sp. CY15W TaxID=2692172 RepID=UPI00136BF70D|nr:phage tail tape measure protein [Duganella sp. CY15W]MYM32265.1 tail tape measure protein [Duganella sp. CY15W]